MLDLHLLHLHYKHLLKRKLVCMVMGFEATYTCSITFVCDQELTLTAKGDHDVCSATVDSSKSQRSDFGPNLQGPVNGIFHLRLSHVGCEVDNPSAWINMQI